MTTVFLVDDHNLLRNGMAGLISQFESYRVCGQASNGREFIETVGTIQDPDIVILDIQMPVMDGEQTARWLRMNKPKIKILVLTMHDDEHNILRMIRAGAGGYILKDIEPKQLRLALDHIRDYGTYHSEMVTSALLKMAGIKEEGSVMPRLTTRELEFIALCCSDMTYKEIADKLQCSVRTVDGYRDEVFRKLGIKNRVSLALYAVKNGMVQV